MPSAPKLSKKLAAEAVGTFIFVLVGAGSAVGASSGIAEPSASLVLTALGNGLGLAVAVTATMAVSGGILNPALALGLASAGKLSKNEVVPYILAELVGAWAAGIALAAALPRSLTESPVNLGAPSLHILTVPQGIAVEALLTFVLMTVVYGTAVDARAPKLGGLFIGLAVVCDVLVAGPLTGAAMNPARAMGPMIAGGFIPSYWYIYWIGPVIGAVAAALVYRYLIEES